jgi:hypothetical protein
MVSASDDRTVKVWDCDGGRELRSIVTDAVMAAVGISGDGLLVLLVTGPRLSVLDVSTCQCVAAFHFDSDITAAAMSGAAGIVVCGDTQGAVHLLRLVARVRVPMVPVRRRASC